MYRDEACGLVNCEVCGGGNNNLGLEDEFFKSFFFFFWEKFRFKFNNLEFNEVHS